MKCKICSETTEIECPKCLKPVCSRHLGFHLCTPLKHSWPHDEDQISSSLQDKDEAFSKEDYKIELKNPKKKKADTDNINNNNFGSTSEIGKKNKVSNDSCCSCGKAFGMEASPNQCPTCGKKFCSDDYAEHKNTICFSSHYKRVQNQKSAAKKIIPVSQRREGGHTLNTVNHDDLVLGVATWNVNHFGEQKQQQDFDDQLMKLEEKVNETKIREKDELIDMINFINFIFHEFYSEDDERYAINEFSEINRLIDINELLQGIKDTIKSKKQSKPIKRVKAALDECRSAIKKKRVAEHIIKLFDKNPWLDVLILQEVNMGMGNLRQDIEEKAPNLHFCSGPLLESFKPGSTGGQNEYYPIILRTESADKTKTIAHKATWAITDKGDKEPKGDNWDCSSEVIFRWTKHTDEAPYRPVVVYDLKVTVGKKKYFVHIGNVHTTPGKSPKEEHGASDGEFRRMYEYNQICEAINKHGIEDYWIIGGDFYLSEESIVIDPKNRKKLKSQLDKNKERMEKLYHETFPAEPNPPNTETQYDKVKDNLKRKYRSTEEPPIVPFDGDDLLRNPLKMTFKGQLPTHWNVLQAVSGSNWHDKKILKGEIPKGPVMRAKFYATARVADFFLYNSYWADKDIGLFRPQGGLVKVDTEQLKFTRYWRDVSDHFPVGAKFSTSRDDKRIDEIFFLHKSAVEQSQELNRSRLRDRLMTLVEWAFENLAEAEYNKLLKLLEIEFKKGQSLAEADVPLSTIKALEQRLGIGHESDQTQIDMINPGDFEPEMDESNQPQNSTYLDTNNNNNNSMEFNQ